MVCKDGVSQSLYGALCSGCFCVRCSCASQQMSGVGVRFGQSKVEITIGLRTSNFVAVATCKDLQESRSNLANFLCCYETTKLRFWIAHDRTVTLICILCISTCIYRYVKYSHKAYRNTSWKCLCLRPQGSAQLPLHAATYTHDHRSTDPKNPKDPPS